MRKALLILRWSIAVPGALLALLIVLPAPSYYLWMAAVAVSEWSVWLLLAGLVSMSCGVGALLRARRSRSNWIVMALSLLMIACAVLPVIQAYGTAGREGVSLSWGRYLFGTGSAAGQVVVDEERDVEFSSPEGHPLRLDVYKPPDSLRGERQATQTAPALLPAIIVIHGGSWRAGDKSDFVRYDRWLVAGGRVVFDVEYRLANDAQHFPAQIVDIKCAIMWVKSHAAQYHVNPARLALMGRSAGGQLALLAAYTPNDPALQTDACGAQDTSVRAVISFYGPTDLAWDFAHPGRPDVIDTPYVLENYLGGTPASAPQAYALASPIEHVSPQSPPTLLLYGGHDQLVRAENAERIIPKLAAAGVPYIYIYLPWANHGFDYSFNGWSSQIAQAGISKFLDRYL